MAFNTPLKRRQPKLSENPSFKNIKASIKPVLIDLAREESSDVEREIATRYVLHPAVLVDVPLWSLVKGVLRVGNSRLVTTMHRLMS